MGRRGSGMDGLGSEWSGLVWVKDRLGLSQSRGCHWDRVPVVRFLGFIDCFFVSKCMPCDYIKKGSHE